MLTKTPQIAPRHRVAKSLCGIMACLVLTTGIWSSAQADTPSLSELQAEFLEQAELRDNLARLMELEQQALALMEDEPLKLGSIGSAILDLYPASQTGHLAMRHYYEHLEASEPQQEHDARLQEIQLAMQQSGNGQPKTPFKIMTMYDAHAFARSQQLSSVGSIYQSSEDALFGFLLIARPENAKLRQIFFDVSHLLEGLGDAKDLHPDHPPNPWSVIRILAAGADSAAQTAIGAYLSNVKKYDDALGWLKVASRTGNILSNTLLARIYWTKSRGVEDPEEQLELQQLAEENYLHAVALGSTDAMYTLANLYLGGDIAAGSQESAIPLLEQAGNLGHAESLVFLAHLYNTGLHIGPDAKDPVKAHDYFQRGAALGLPTAVLSYGRYLVAEQSKIDTEEGIFDALNELAKADNTDAMIVLANLHARKIAPRANKRSASRWYKKAVRAAPDNADVVNEVAWTLTVSDLEEIRQPRYAKRIMDKLMRRSEEAQQRPEYLDTWAATLAATGDFEGAIELQQRAINVAQQLGRDDVLEILNEHLQKFQAKTAIIETAP